MFYGCSGLSSLDLSNFNIPHVIYINNIFSNCNRLQFINLFNYYGQDIFKTIPFYANLTICIKYYSQINKGENILKNNNVLNMCRSPILTQISETIISTIFKRKLF